MTSPGGGCWWQRGSARQGCLEGAGAAEGDLKGRRAPVLKTHVSGSLGPFSSVSSSDARGHGPAVVVLWRRLSQGQGRLDEPAAAPALLGGSPNWASPGGFAGGGRGSLVLSALMAAAQSWSMGGCGPALACSCSCLRGLAHSHLPSSCTCMDLHVLACTCMLLHVLVCVCVLLHALHTPACSCSHVHGLTHSCMSLLMHACSCMLWRAPTCPCLHVHPSACSSVSLLACACYYALLHVLAHACTLLRALTHFCMSLLACACSDTLLRVLACACMLLHSLGCSCVLLARMYMLQHAPTHPCSHMHPFARSCTSLLTHTCMLWHTPTRPCSRVYPFACSFVSLHALARSCTQAPPPPRPCLRGRD